MSMAFELPLECGSVTADFPDPTPFASAFQIAFKFYAIAIQYSLEPEARIGVHSTRDFATNLC